MEKMFEVNDYVICNTEEEEDWMFDIAEHIASNNELSSNRYFENMKKVDDSRIKLTATFNRADFQDLSHEEIRDKIFQNVEKLANWIEVEILERKKDGSLNIIVLSQ